MRSKGKKTEALKLDIGGGLFPIKGFVNVDLYADGADIEAPAWDLPWSDDMAAEIYCSHVLEHIEKRMVVPTLCEFYRVLRPSGVLTIEVPDLVWCCENWLKTQDDGWNLDVIFGNQDPPGGQFHFTGFTKKLLVDKLTNAGFHICEAAYVWTHNQQCIKVVSVKGI